MSRQRRKARVSAHLVHPNAVPHGTDDGGERGEEHENTVHAEGGACAVGPPGPALPVRGQHADHQEEEIEEEVDQEPCHGGKLDADELLQTIGAVLPPVEIPLGSFGLAVAGDEARLADVQPVLGEELD